MTQHTPAPGKTPQRRPLWAAVLSMIALALLTMGADDCDRRTPCLYGGEVYRPGQSFPSTDGCNTCSCSPGGAVACTLRACAPDRCGGIAGLACDDGEYCRYSPDALCGAADATGICLEIPELCTEEYQPVCGCDDQTYSNACMAASQGVSVAHEGSCESDCSDIPKCRLACPPGTVNPVDENGCVHTCECAAAGPSCGGFAGIPCPGAGSCEDDPRDDCDPERGGADCSGICRCNATALCIGGLIWDGSADVCACVEP